MQQLLVFQGLVLMLLLQHQNLLILINYAKISYKVVFGMENQLEDVGIPPLFVLIIKDLLANVQFLLSLDKNILIQ